MTKECTWDPNKHGGLPCPKHGKTGYWDENILNRQEKLKAAGYAPKDLEDEDLSDSEFDDDFEFDDDENNHKKE